MRFNPAEVFYQIPAERPCSSLFKLKIFQMSELICSLLASICIFLALIVTDLAKSEEAFNSARTSASILLVLSSVSTLFLLAATTWRAFCEMNWKKSKLFLSTLDNLLSSHRIYSLLIELIINSIHPVYGLHQAYFEHYNDAYDITIQYSYNEVLSVFSLLKIYHLIRVLTIYSPYQSSRSQRLCTMNGVFAGNRYAIKCLIQQRPLIALPVLLFSGVILFSYGMYIFDRPIGMDISFSLMGFINCFWCIFITMSTTGFGDYYPITTYGRVTGMLACVYGLMICTLRKGLEMNESEKASLKLIRVLELKKQARKVAMRLISSMIVCKFKMNKKENCKKTYLKFRKHLRNFEIVRRSLVSALNSYSFNEFLERKLIHLQSQSTAIEMKQKRIEELLLLNGFGSTNT